jgi:hypothetical protein
MPPAPARIASTPRQNSRTSWNPAVPPPPVPGGAEGNELADGLGDGDGDGDGLGLGLGAVAPGTVPDAVALGVLVLGVLVLGVLVLGVLVLGVLVLGGLVLGVVVLGVLLAVVAPGVPLAETAGVAEPVRPGGNDGGVVGGEPDEQADTNAAASMAKAAQPRTVPGKRRRP